MYIYIYTHTVCVCMYRFRYFAPSLGTSTCIHTHTTRASYYTAICICTSHSSGVFRLARHACTGPWMQGSSTWCACLSNTAPRNCCLSRPGYVEFVRLYFAMLADLELKFHRGRYYIPICKPYMSTITYPVSKPYISTVA